MEDEKKIEELFQELARIRKYAGRKMNDLMRIANAFDFPDSEEFWSARQALLLTQKYHTNITGIYNSVVESLNREYHKRHSEK